jgi:hypothetical protein
MNLPHLLEIPSFVVGFQGKDWGRPVGTTPYYFWTGADTSSRGSVFFPAESKAVCRTLRGRACCGDPVFCGPESPKTPQ